MYLKGAKFRLYIDLKLFTFFSHSCRIVPRLSRPRQRKHTLPCPSFNIDSAVWVNSEMFVMKPLCGHYCKSISVLYFTFYTNVPEFYREWNGPAAFPIYSEGKQTCVLF